MIKIHTEYTAKGAISWLRNAESSKQVGLGDALMKNPITGEYLTDVSTAELIKKAIGYRNTDTGEYVSGLMKPEDLATDQLYLKLQDMPGYNTKKRLTGSLKKGQDAGKGGQEANLEFTHVVIHIPDSVPPEKWVEWRDAHAKNFCEPHEWWSKNKGGGKFSPNVHLGETLTFVTPVHVEQDGSGPHFHIITHSRTLNYKNYYGVDHNGQPQLISKNPDWRSITSRTLISQASEWRDLKIANINEKLKELGLTETRWLKKDQAVDDNQIKAKELVKDVISSSEEQDVNLGEDLTEHLDGLKSAKELASQEIKIDDIQDAILHKEIMNQQKLLAVISKRAEETLAAAYRDIELVNLTKQSINSSISLAHTKQQLDSTKELLEKTQVQLEYEKTAKDTIEAALLKKSGDFENLTADYNNLKEENKELIQSFDALEEKYEELENTLTLTNAQHEVDITNIQNSYETQIQANNQSHAKAIQALEDKLNEQELYYERELSSKDTIIEEQRLEIEAIREENDIVIDGFNTTINVHMEDKNKLNKTINDLKTSKENQRIRFDEIIEQLKKGHEEAISKLKDSNRELTEQIASQIKDITTLKNEKKELETKNKTLNEQLEVRKNEVEELIKSNNALISENKDLNTALELYENDNKERLEDSKKEKNNNPDPKKPKNK
ncbi:hypothetical protein EF694_22380 [Salmonella enterica subsp. enterica]|uniref:Uncharacterized protein n=1 Tax=Salmonella enterica subsp. enterica serovar Braenderup TaxID=149391 RepID=A0A5J1FHE3_SALET|nr:MULTISPECIES: hypothetical protein [Enterobacteriaceae]EAA4174181.1 hypothetical protein [Salmonella enterica subsp. enterica serovar Braenderup]EAC0045544.1 hypothetical protein [Salmonella enterica subsp. enterica serovar Senftenberg]EAN4118241.1 hypothetical protein [Salmonella enterica]HDW5818905.1 hypothetical protein [Salmonella enterica subsp. enterica serovar Typhi]EAC0012700.1 hypothetical protein [Salmonella enterica subsp. enterica serovar Braenderup]